MSTSIRRAQREFHCYACQNTFRQLVDLSDLSSVRCPTCQGDFIEQRNSTESPRSNSSSTQASSSQPSAPQQQMSPQQLAPQVSQQAQHSSGVQLPQMRHAQTINRAFSPSRGWTQSVTISYGGNGQATVTHSSQPQQEAPRENIESPFAMMDDFFGSPFELGQQRPPSPPSSANDRQEGPATMYDRIFSNIFSGLAGQRRQAPPQSGCSEDFIKNLPQKEATKETDCYICLEKCKDGEQSCQLPCGHAFDKACIEQWIKSNNSCPVCRTKLDQSRPSQQQAEQDQQRQQQRQHPTMGAAAPNMFFFAAM